MHIRCHMKMVYVLMSCFLSPSSPNNIFLCRGPTRQNCHVHLSRVVCLGFPEQVSRDSPALVQKSMSLVVFPPKPVAWSYTPVRIVRTRRSTWATFKFMFVGILASGLFNAACAMRRLQQKIISTGTCVCTLTKGRTPVTTATLPSETGRLRDTTWPRT